MNRFVARLTAAVIGISLLVSSAAVFAQDLKPPVHAIDLQDGDTLVFLGDSITHQCLYTQYVEDYYYTRFPNRRIRFYNAGVSGDKAGDALARFAEDVKAQKAKYITVLLGMNDGTYRHFDRETFDRYETDMTTVVEKIAETGATAVLMGPSMYDARVSIANPPRWIAKDPEQAKEVTGYYSAVLAFYGAWCRDQATHRGLGYVDLQGPMEQLTRAQRVQNPAFTMIPDAVHPDANGQAVMAFSLLEQMQATRQVSAVTARRVAGKWRVNSGTGKVTEVEGDNQQLQFSFQANALPWVLPSEAAAGYAMTKAGHKMSNERLVVSGLEPGRYDLSIDGVKVGTYAHTQLAAKIELQANQVTPQYQQALAVAQLNKERNEKAIRPLRNAWAQLRNKFTRPGKLGTDQYREYRVTFDKDIASLNQLSVEYEDEIYAANQPRNLQYEIAPASR